MLNHLDIIIISVIFNIIENNKMNFEIPVERKDYYKAALMTVNIPLNLRLTNMEMDMVACILNNNKVIIDHEIREIMAFELDKDMPHINNYIVSLKKKNILITKPADKLLYINTVIVDLLNDNNMTFNLKINDENN